MFVSPTDGKTTSTIRVHAGEHLAVTAVFLFFGLWLVIGSIPHPIKHNGALAIGVLLLLMGFVLGHVTWRLIFGAARAYHDATRSK